MHSTQFPPNTAIRFASHFVYAEPTVKKRNGTEEKKKRSNTAQHNASQSFPTYIFQRQLSSLAYAKEKKIERKRNYAGNGVPRRKQRPHFAFLLNNKLSNKYQFSIWKIINFQLFPALRVHVRVYWWISIHSLHIIHTRFEHCELWVAGDAFALFFFFRS